MSEKVRCDKHGSSLVCSNCTHNYPHEAEKMYYGNTAECSDHWRRGLCLLPDDQATFVTCVPVEGEEEK